MKYPELCYGLLWKEHSCPFPQSSYALPKENPGCRGVGQAPKVQDFLSLPGERESTFAEEEDLRTKPWNFICSLTVLFIVWFQNCVRKQWMNSLLFSASVHLLLYPLNYLFFKRFFTFLLLPLFLFLEGSEWLGWSHCRTGAALEASRKRERANGTDGRSTL